MITPQELAKGFEMHLQSVKDITKGLSHADTVLQLPFQGNCMNWTLGHVVDTRNLVLKLLGQAPLLTEAQAKRYGYGSQPVCGDGDDILKLETLLALLEQSQSTLNAALGRISPEELAKEVPSFMGKVSLGFFLFILYGHESWHLGQVEMLKELAGPKA
jgi:hypothetical protein